MKTADWIGRPVKIVDGISENIGEEGIVLAVDDSDWRPSAWVKVGLDCKFPQYRSVDLCWLEDAVTGEGGPVWGDNHGIVASNKAEAGA